MASNERFRRPRQHADLIASLSDKLDSPFTTMVEAMMFAAMLGRRKGKRESFEQHDEPIRISAMEQRPYGEIMLDMLAAVEHQDDPKILSDDRAAERVLIFEEYANGGLSYLQAQINRHSNQAADVVIANLVLEELVPKQEDGIGQVMKSASLGW
ncbi:DNA phosphorothioation-associated protein 4 [Streptomyces griseus]|uniref:DNA phosphorothioation-associated protein 4 n=1 Tax=Streptomyces griseus TaxID=1911 RepID=UPI00367F936F